MSAGWRERECRTTRFLTRTAESPTRQVRTVEGMTGIEPALSAWEAYLPSSILVRKPRKSAAYRPEFLCGAHIGAHIAISLGDRRTFNWQPQTTGLLARREHNEHRHEPIPYSESPAFTSIANHRPRFADQAFISHTPALRPAANPTQTADLTALGGDCTTNRALTPQSGARADGCRDFSADHGPAALQDPGRGPSVRGSGGARVWLARPRRIARAPRARIAVLFLRSEA